MLVLDQVVASRRNGCRCGCWALSWIGGKKKKMWQTTAGGERSPHTADAHAYTTVTHTHDTHTTHTHTLTHTHTSSVSSCGSGESLLLGDLLLDVEQELVVGQSRLGPVLDHVLHEVPFLRAVVPEATRNTTTNSTDPQREINGRLFLSITQPSHFYMHIM